MPGQIVPPLVKWEANARNGQSPSSSFYAQAIHAQNFNMVHRTREIFAMSWPLGAAHSATGTTSWRFRFRSRHGATRLRAHVIALQPNRYDATDPRIEIDVDDGSTTETIGPFYCPLVPSSTTPTNGPDEWISTNSYCAISSNTAYSCTLKAMDWAKIAAVMVHEEIDDFVDPAIDHFVSYSPHVGAPLWDSLREKLLRGSVEMWQRGGGTLVHWTNPDATSRNRTSATLINLIDDATTGSPATSAPGFYLDLNYRNRLSQSTVGFELAVWGAIPSGTGTVTVTDSGGTDRITCNVNNSVPQWFTATGGLVAGENWHTFRFAGNGTSQLSVAAVSLIEVEL